MKIKFTSEWSDDLIWCPSQLRRDFIFTYKKREVELQLYCRWRHEDPWQFCILSPDPDVRMYRQFDTGMSEKDTIQCIHSEAEYRLNKYLKKHSKELYLEVMINKLEKI